MKKQADFMEVYRRDKAELQSMPYSPPGKRKWQRFELTKELVQAKSSQYERRKSEDRWNRLVDEFYPLLCEIAEMQGGRVELDISEETLIGQLIYTGEELFLDENTCNLKEGHDIVTAASDTYLSVRERCFRIQLMFPLFDEVFVEDHSEQIEKIQKKIQATGLMPCFRNGRLVQMKEQEREQDRTTK